MSEFIYKKSKDKSDDINNDGLNEGTKLKQQLQQRALKFMLNYPCKQTLEGFAELLCWDLNMTYGNVLASYIKPMMRHGYLIYEGDNLFTFIGNGKSNEKIKKEKIDKDSVENKESATDYMIRKNEEKENEGSVKNEKNNEKKI